MRGYPTRAGTSYQPPPPRGSVWVRGGFAAPLHFPQSRPIGIRGVKLGQAGGVGVAWHSGADPQIMRLLSRFRRGLPKSPHVPRPENSSSGPVVFCRPQAAGALARGNTDPLALDH